MAHQNDSRNLAAGRIEDAMRGALAALPQYPEPKHRADDIMRGRNSTAATLAYVYVGISESPDMTLEQRRAEAMRLINEQLAVVDMLMPDATPPSFGQCAIEEEEAEGMADLAECRAMIRYDALTRAELVRCADRHIEATRRLRLRALLDEQQQPGAWAPVRRSA